MLQNMPGEKGEAADVQGQKGERMMGWVGRVQRPELQKQKQVPGRGWERLGLMRTKWEKKRRNRNIQVKLCEKKTAADGPVPADSPLGS